MPCLAPTRGHVERSDRSGGDARLPLLRKPSMAPPLITMARTRPESRPAAKARNWRRCGAAWRADQRGCAPSSLLALALTRFRLRHGLQRDQQAVRSEHRPDARASPATCRASSAAWWRTNRGPHWSHARCCPPAATRRTRRWRSASPCPSRCRRAPAWAAAARAWPMPPTRSRRTAGCRRRCCSRRSPPASLGANADRPAAVPMLARGLYLLHARYGHLPFESLIVPAEQLARFGTPASRALVRDLALVAGPLLADPNARAVFSSDGTPLVEGQTLLQPDLAATLTQLRVAGVGDFYTGALARGSSRHRRWPAGRSPWPICAPRCRGWRRRSCCRTATTRWRSCRRRPMAAWPPPPASWSCSATRTHSASAAARALAVAARWRAGRASIAQALLHRVRPAGGAAAAAARLHQLRHAGQGRQRGRLRAQHGQPVRHRARPARARLPARGLARRGAAAAVCRGDRLERQHPRVPRRGRRLRPGGSRRWRWPSEC